MRPPRKEPKETVVYPASKRKPPPFKPQRPSKVPRIPTTDSESTRPRISKPTAPARRKQTRTVDDDDEESEGENSGGAAGTQRSDSDEELDDNPLAAKRKKTMPRISTESAASKRRQPRELSPMSVDSRRASNVSFERPSAAPDPPPAPSQSDGAPAIPQPLLVRLLHEHFADKKTKIDKHAIQVLQKYFEVFVRETIARAKLQKQEDIEKANGGSSADANWLELEDLEKVAAGMLLDF